MYVVAALFYGAGAVSSSASNRYTSAARKQAVLNKISVFYPHLFPGLLGGTTVPLAISRRVAIFTD